MDVKYDIKLPDLFPDLDFSSIGKTLPDTPTSVPNTTPGMVAGEILEKSSAGGTSSNWITALKWTGGVLAVGGIIYLIRTYVKSQEDKD